MDIILVDGELCDACGDCIITCPVKALKLKRVKDKTTSYLAEPEFCCGDSCQLCISQCHTLAISLQNAELNRNA